jgi:hypothetical protein
MFNASKSVALPGRPWRDPQCGFAAGKTDRIIPFGTPRGIIFWKKIMSNAKWFKWQELYQFQKTFSYKSDDSTQRPKVC